MTFSLKSRLSLTIAMVALLTVALISFLSNYFIQDQFKVYITNQQKKTASQIVESISVQYDDATGAWNRDFVHTIGMYALYDGYNVKVYDRDGNTLWDAETCDMRRCTQVMDDITFLDALNKILVSVGGVSLLISVITGIFLARNLSRPILKTVDMTRDIADGKYSTRIDEDTGTIEVDQLIGSINHLAQSLESQESLRRQMTADLAHEIRTPLTTVQTHIEAMMEGVWEPTEDRLTSCYDELSRLGELISDLENLAKVESDNLKLNKKEISLSELTGKVLGSYEKELQDKGLRVEVVGNCSAIWADSDRISQVMVNLISNAVKYSPDGGEIRITLSNSGDSVMFNIQDSGIGIPEAELPYIFERFYRADKSRNRNTGGSGIGLAIVKSIVAAHGGTVDVESRLNEGSNFIITLPKE